MVELSSNCAQTWRRDEELGHVVGRYIQPENTLGLGLCRCPSLSVSCKLKHTDVTVPNLDPVILQTPFSQSYDLTQWWHKIEHDWAWLHKLIAIDVISVSGLLAYIQLRSKTWLNTYTIVRSRSLLSLPPQSFLSRSHLSHQLLSNSHFVISKTWHIAQCLNVDMKPDLLF